MNLEATSATSISTTISDNLISGNGESGILVQPDLLETLSTFTITNNLIGTNAAGTAALGNASVGLQLGSVENATVLNNLISGNNLGVQLSGFGPDVEHNVFQGNLIGTDKTGLVALGNTEGGMYLSAAIGNAIGGTGPGQGNVIANSDFYGIYLEAGQQIQFTRNSIFGNSKQGIYRGYGANGFVNEPILTFAPGAGNTGTLSGMIDSPQFKNTTLVIDIYSNPTDQATEGQTFVQDVTVTTDGTGQGSFSVSEPTGFYTATSTDPSGDTSDFSAVAATVAALADTVTTVTSSANPSTPGQKVTFTAAVTAPATQGTPTGTLTFTIDGQAQTPVPIAVFGGVDEAQFQTSALTAGAHSISAAYSGDSNVGPSSGSLSTQVVNAAAVQPAATMTALESSLNPSTVGEDVTLTAVVTAPGSADVPTGTVSFTVDGQEVADVALSVVGGIDEAQVITSALTVGQHSVTAAYGGDTSSSPSTASLPTQVVNATAVQSTATTTALESSLNPSMVGEQVTFTAVVTELGSAGVPTGAVTFTIDGQAHAPVSLSVIGGVDEAKFVTSTLTAGQHSVAAAYSGDTSFASSTVVSPLSQVVNRLATSPAQGTSPTVLLVQRFGVHMHPTVLMLTFSSALDPSTAENVHNYRIVDPSGRRVAIESAVYNATANTVTLQPAERINLHHTYQLMVIGSGSSGVAGADHALLDGVHDGDAGSNFVTTLNWKNVVLTPAEFLKIHAASGAKPAGALVHRFVLARR